MKDTITVITLWFLLCSLWVIAVSCGMDMREAELIGENMRNDYSRGYNDGQNDCARLNT